MLFERFEVKGLAHYSYAVGCPEAGKLAIVDPKRDVDSYLDFAEAQALRISHVLETHIHADFASGARELAARSGAELFVSAYDRDEIFQVSFPHQDLYEKDSIEIGSVRIQALHTPGHTPEHLSFLILDTSRADDLPQIMLSGDFLFVGSIGRPDLLGEEAKRRLATQLYASIKDKLQNLPDGLEVHPAHGAGSMCGAGIGGRPHTTLGYERIANPYLSSRFSEGEFVDKVLSALPPFPDYYKRMKKLNSEGPPLLPVLPGLQALEVKRFEMLVQSGATVVDLRDQPAFGGAHIPDSLGIGAGPNFPVWAAWVVPYEKPVVLIAPSDQLIEDAVRSLVRVGLDEVKGYLKGGIQGWREAGKPLASTRQISVTDLHHRLAQDRGLRVLDVRSDAEWDTGHIETAVHIFAGELAKRIDRVGPAPEALAVICGSGYRSTVAAGVLERNGYENLFNVTGGMEAWKNAGLPIV